MEKKWWCFQHPSACGQWWCCSSTANPWNEVVCRKMTVKFCRGCSWSQTQTEWNKHMCMKKNWIANTLPTRCVTWTRMNESKRDIIKYYCKKIMIYGPFRHTQNDWLAHFSASLRIHFFVQVDEDLVDVACSRWQVLLPFRTPHKVSTHRVRFAPWP